MYFWIQILTLCHLTFGEYRVYNLQIENSDNGKTREIQSTLDQYQYSAYYPLQASEKVRYLKSWKCWGRFEYEAPLCPSPEATSLPQKANSPVAPAPTPANP